MSLRVLHPYLLRFGPEILTFWLICLANSLARAAGGDLRWISLFSILEILALTWITVRLVLAEDGFRVSAGWRCRPVAPLAGHLAPFALATIVVLLPMLLRAMALKRIFGTETEGIAGIFLQQTTPLLAAWCAVAGCLKLYGMLILRGVEERARVAAWAVLALLLVPIVALIGRAHAPHAMSEVQSSAPYDPRDLAPGIRRALPDAVDFIGAWNDPSYTKEIPEVKILLRVSDHGPTPAGIKIRSFDAWREGARIALRVRAIFLDPKQSQSLMRGVPVLRFADGTYATCTQARLTRLRGGRFFAGVTEWECSVSFVSPLSLPEFTGHPDQLLENLEILWFDEDLSKPYPIHGNIVENDDQERKNHDPNLVNESIDPNDCFNQMPWSARQWREGVLPSLMKNLRESDLPLLLEHLPEDPRLIEVIARKGWLARALPVLREQAAAQRPGSALGFSLLAGDLDSSWNDDLMTLALGSRSGLETWEKALRDKPGFDWDAYAREAWRRRKTQINWLETDSAGEFWLSALWAAQAGDESAFRHTVEHAARGKAWELGQLEHLIEDGGMAPLERIRAAGIDSFRYDPESRRWASR